MISAELKSIDFNNIHILTRNDAYLEMLKPVYYLSLVLSIGVLGKDGADYFYVDVFNTGWIEKERFLIGKKVLLLILMILMNLRNILGRLLVEFTEIIGKTLSLILKSISIGNMTIISLLFKRGGVPQSMLFII